MKLVRVGFPPFWLDGDVAEIFIYKTGLGRPSAKTAQMSFI